MVPGIQLNSLAVEEMFEELPKKELKLETVVLFAVVKGDTSLLSSIHYLVLVLGGVRLTSGRSNFLMTSHFLTGRPNHEIGSRSLTGHERSQLSFIQY